MDITGANIEGDEIALATSILMAREELPESVALNKLHRAAAVASVPPHYVARLIIRSEELTATI